MAAIEVEFEITIEARLVQDAKALLPMVVTELHMTTDVKLVQDSKA